MKNIMNESFWKIVSMANKYNYLKRDYENLLKENLELKTKLANNVCNDIKHLSEIWKKENLKTRLHNKLKHYLNISHRTTKETKDLKDEITIIIEALKVL